LRDIRTDQENPYRQQSRYTIQRWEPDAGEKGEWWECSDSFDWRDPDEAIVMANRRHEFSPTLIGSELNLRRYRVVREITTWDVIHDTGDES